MPKRVKFELELPDAVLDALGEESLSSKTKEALVMQLLREHRIPQGKAAHLMGISRYDIFPLMAKYQISFIDERELDEELNKRFP